MTEDRISTDQLVPVAELLRLDGRGAVVTGAARGLGHAIAERLAEAGASVALSDVEGGAAEDAARELSARHPETRTVAVPADVRDPAAVHALADTAVREFGRLDVWVNNAGIFPAAHPVGATAEQFERITAVNVTGTHLGCQAAAQAMIDSGRGGVIVNIASTAAFRGAGAYSASKWAVRGMTKGLAAELGRHNIRVVAVAPSLTATPGITEVQRGGGQRLERYFDDIVAALPLGRAGVPDDIARAVLFLASDAAAFITGVTLPVDGGELAP